MDKLNIALVGVGYWGANYIRVLKQLKEVKLDYICDKDHSTLEKYRDVADDVKLTDDVNELAKDQNLQLIIVAAPASTHYEITKTMLEARKHVLVEKPLTMNFGDAVKLVNLAKKMETTIMVGHIYRFNQSVNYIENVLRSGRLGDLFYGVGLRIGLGPIRNDASCTWDLATHDIAMLDFLLNKMPKRISAHGSSFLRKGGEIYDYANVFLDYDDGFRFSFTVSWYAPEKIRTWYLMGSKGMLKFDDNKNPSITIYDKSVIVTPASENNILNVDNILPKEGDTVVPYINQSEPLMTEVRHFIESAKNGSIPLTDGWQGARVVRVLEAIEESIKNNGKLITIKENEGDARTWK
jgi:predicted dehydrogenase